MTTVPLYPETYPATIPADKQERAVDNFGCIFNVHYPTLDVYLPEAAKATGCGVVVCPGGGYNVLAADHEGKQIAEMFNSFGIAAFVLKYRLPPDYMHPIPLQDAQRAVRLVRASAEMWLVRPDRIGIIGFSAGGHLASTAATLFDSGKPQSSDMVDRLSCRPDFAVLGYPVISFARDYCHAGSRTNLLGEPLPPDLVELLASDLRVTKDTPPTFLFHSADDSGVDPRNSVDFFLACQKNGVSVSLHIFPTGGHGFGLGTLGSNEAQWPTLLHKWLENMGMLKR